MKKYAWVALVSGLLLMAVSHGSAQLTFQDLDFESANVPVVPAGQLGSFVAFSDAFPGWTGYLGTQQTASAGEDILTLGAPNISILAPNWAYNESIPIIEGNYAAVIQAGEFPPNAPESAAIAQSGLVPVTAQSIEMKIQQLAQYAPLLDELRVTVGGQNIVMVPLQVAATYTLYGGDISAFAGQVEELRIAALPVPQDSNSSFQLDSIEFSGLAVPEPGSLSIGSAAFFAAVLFAQRKQLKVRTNHRENNEKAPNKVAASHAR